MPMNFWAAQQRARRKTALYLFCFIVLTAIVAALAEWAMRTLDPVDYDPPYPLIGAFFLAFTFVIAGFYYLSYKRHGGRYVAEALGAHEVSPNTSDFAEKRLLNIVEEIAVASALPVPPVYILENEQINAFAAGLTPETAAVTVTRGTLEQLSRDELQGVLAHEFGHIKNGDMLIGMRLAAMVMGFFILFYLGLRLTSLPIRSRDERRGDPIGIAILVLLVAGSLTYFFGSILRSMVSRQREYLADASAVQFTRNPTGIAGALRKILNADVHDMPKTGIAYSHLYFDNSGSVFDLLFATHPPLKKRIAAIEGERL
jgi:heat shock protein HtpX